MSEPQPIQIRRAHEGDLDELAHVLVDTWRTTFRGLLSDAFLDGMSYTHQKERHLRTMARPDTFYFVAVRADDVIGFINGGPSRHHDYPYAGELYAIYIRAGFQRGGIGRSLFCALAAELIQSGLPSMLVWVLVDNPNRRFYESVGGVMSARRPIVLGTETVDEDAFAWNDLAATLREHCSLADRLPPYVPRLTKG